MAFGGNHLPYLSPQKLSYFLLDFQKLHEVWKGFFKGFNLRPTATSLLYSFRSYNSTKAKVKTIFFNF